MAGLALILAVFVTPLHPIALHYLLSIHLLQNVVLAEWAPALCVIGLPAAIPGPRLLTHPFVALPLWAGTYFVWHVPAVYDAALRHQELAAPPRARVVLRHRLPLLVACAPQRATSAHRRRARDVPLRRVRRREPARPPARAHSTPVYDYYVQAPRLWGLSPLTDQQIGGAAMALEQAAVLFAVGTWFFLRFLSGEARADAFRTLDPSSYNHTREMRDGR